MDMQTSAGLTLLTVTEAADYLRMGERKLYELVAEGGVPCTKVTGKWLFPRGELDTWMTTPSKLRIGWSAGGGAGT